MGRPRQYARYYGTLRLEAPAQAREEYCPHDNPTRYPLPAASYEGAAMSRVATLKERASHSPIRTFLVILGLYSGLAAAALYGLFGSSIPTSGVMLYAWAPMVSAGITVRMVDESVRGWLGQLRNLRAGIH